MWLKLNLTNKERYTWQKTLSDVRFSHFLQPNLKILLNYDLINHPSDLLIRAICMELTFATKILGWI